MTEPPDALLARHYRQLRTTRGTVLLGPASYGADAEIDPSWFVDGCPLEPAEAVSALVERHGLRDDEAALRALHDLRRELRTQRHGDAKALADLPDAPATPR